MPSPQPNLFTRPDTFFGICEALGEDLRIHANLFRILFAALLFWSPPTAIGAYAAAGMLVGLSRWLYPNPRPASVVEAAASEPVAAPAPALEAEPVALAA
jgi:phage shock protein PspC (stress-responsive transcriptional regulator)